MKIDWKSKNTKITIIILAVILIPTLWHKVSGGITGLITVYQMSQPKEVQVAHPTVKDIYEKYETTGRIEAKYSMNIIARVNGWLEKRFFEEGDKVKKGQKLFQIEPNEYVLAAHNAQASVNENQAVYNNSQIELRRAKELIKEDFVSREYYDNALATRNKNRAALDGSIAQYNKARLDLSYTNVTAPFDGRVGKVEITEGNYVTASSGNLTTVYSTDPMKVVFTVKSSDFISIKKHMLEHNITKTGNKPETVAVKLKLADGTFYKYDGKVEFIDNKINADTGTVSLRAIFSNPDEILVPGDYVNVVLQATKTTPVMVIPQDATKTDVGTGYYVWVINKDNETEKRDIKVKYNIDNCWVVENGLNYDDVIVTSGVQNIYHSGQKVKPVFAKGAETPKVEQTQDKKVKKNPAKSIVNKIKNKVKNKIKALKK